MPVALIGVETRFIANLWLRVIKDQAVWLQDRLK
jgi:hypothetical protein